MKKMSKILAIFMVLTMMFSLAACGGDKDDKGGSNAPKTTAVSGDMVKAELPSGWILVTGTEIFGTDTADLVCHTEKYQTGDPYLQIEEYPQDLDAAKAVLESGKPYGAYNGEKELANGTWYLSENAAVAQIDEKVFIVKGYKCDFGSEDVHTILGSLRWVK